MQQIRMTSSQGNEAQLIQCNMQLMQERVSRIKDKLECQKEDLLKGIREQIGKLIKKKKSSDHSEESEENQQSFNIYLVTSENIINTLFPLLQDHSYISLQSESDINDKLDDLKVAVKKNLKFMHEKIAIGERQQMKKNENLDHQKTSKKKAKNMKIPSEACQILTNWLTKHFKSPYPTTAEKQALAKESGLQVVQVNNWFINARERVVKKYLHRETKKQEQKDSD